MSLLRNFILCVSLVLSISPWAVAASHTFNLTINQNRLITVNDDVKDIFVSDPNLVVVHAPSNRHVMVSGKALGETRHSGTWGQCSHTRALQGCGCC
ncbi:pilus assembly protein N-terminal domain-containing protein [Vibrio natriegens]|uniref:pilus assembly protein N-terminal domain-containing protein n=1 Tax=Vibrio natriegens TaxID=691 RepID=UPI003DA15831